MKIRIIVGETVLNATLFDHETARALAAWLPMTLEMSELNGNEKYHYLLGSLPTDERVPEKICAGDLMLFGDRCLVLFYRDLTTLYRYTPLGHVDDPAGLAGLLGSGDIRVTLEEAEEARHDL